MSWKLKSETTRISANCIWSRLSKASSSSVLVTWRNVWAEKIALPHASHVYITPPLNVKISFPGEVTIVFEQAFNSTTSNMKMLFVVAAIVLTVVNGQGFPGLPLDGVDTDNFSQYQPLDLRKHQPQTPPNMSLLWYKRGHGICIFVQYVVSPVFFI